MDLTRILEGLKIEKLNDMQTAVLTAAKQNSDLVLLAPTGSGKTVAFLLPVLETLIRLSTEERGRAMERIGGVRVIILVPSRELALQVEQVFKRITTDYKVACCYGGHSVKTEKNNLEQAPSVLIGTPGRIEFHLREGNFDESMVSMLVLDEFDKSLEFGFQQDMSSIIESLRSLEQRLLVSATSMPEIPDFTGLTMPVYINYLDLQEKSGQLTVKKVIITQDRFETLFKLISKIGEQTMLVFCNQREMVTELSDFLMDRQVDHEIFHGGLEQIERERALLKFRNGTVRILISTDLASRGLDISHVKHVIHFQKPVTEEAYIHRNGRTARMAESGTAYMLIEEGENISYLPSDSAVEEIDGSYNTPKPTLWETLYIAAGKKDKVNKVDIVGLLLKKGQIAKEDVGLIEVKDQSSYVAVKRELVNSILNLLSNEKIKNKKVKISVAYRTVGY